MLIVRYGENLYPMAARQRRSPYPGLATHETAPVIRPPQRPL
jgi:hypothetical protein